MLYYGFGVEIECYPDTYHLCEVLRRDYEIKCEEEEYNHDTEYYWKIVPDSSLKSGGREVVSPPLKGDKGKEELKAVCEALKYINATVDKYCGLHVHVRCNGPRPISLAQMMRVIIIYGHYENVIDWLMPKS